VEIFRTLARELHDDFGQVLTALGAMLQRAKRRIPEDSPAQSDLIEIREVGTGRTVRVPNLAANVVLPVGPAEWQPAEFLVCVTAEGLLGTPVETVSSDVEDVDVFLRDYLANTLRLGERLAPGMYRVIVGP